jgi:hypothetical protein
MWTSFKPGELGQYSDSDGQDLDVHFWNSFLDVPSQIILTAPLPDLTSPHVMIPNYAVL